MQLPMLCFQDQSIKDKGHMVDGGRKASPPRKQIWFVHASVTSRCTLGVWFGLSLTFPPLMPLLNNTTPVGKSGPGVWHRVPSRWRLGHESWRSSLGARSRWWRAQGRQSPSMTSISWACEMSSGLAVVPAWQLPSCWAQAPWRPRRDLWVRQASIWTWKKAVKFL